MSVVRSKSAFALVVAVLGVAALVIALRFAGASGAHTQASAQIAGSTQPGDPSKVENANAPDSRERFRLAASTRARPTSAIPGGQAGLIPAEERARMDRMADNLLKHADVDATGAAHLREDWRRRYKAEPDRMARMEIITEMATLDEPDTVREMLEFLAGEQDSGVRQQIVLIVGYMRSTLAEMPAVNEALAAEYRHCGNEEERLRILEVQSTLPASHAVEFMRAAFSANDATPAERSIAAQGLFQLARGETKIEPQLIRQFTDKLRADAQSAPSGQDRLLAIRALASPGQDNKQFFAQLLNSEKDEDVRKFLTLAAQQYPTE